MAPRLQERLAAKELAEIQAAIIASTNDAANTSSVVSTTPADVSGVTDILSLPTAGSDIPQTEINYNDHQSLSETTPQNMAGAMENVSEDTEMTTENSVEATTESMSSMEQSITQTRRTNPKRQAALKAVGRYAMEEMVTSVDEVSTQMSLSTFSRKSSKRTRTEAFGDAENTLEDQTFTAPDMINEGKTTTMVMRDRTLPNYGNVNGAKGTNSARAETKTKLSIIQASGDDEKDKDFNAGIRIPTTENSDGTPRDYALRIRKNVKYTYAPIEETDDSSGEPLAVITETSEKAVKEEGESGSNGDLSQFSSTTVTVVKKKKKPIKIPGVFTNKYKIRFGFTPFADHTNPSEQMCHEVFDILAKYHAHEVKLERYLANPDSSNDIGDAGPMHAGQEVTFTAILRTVLSQATSNLNALYAEKCLIDRFRYNFLGARVKGETANYHEMRKTPEHVLAQVLAPGGLHIKKAKLIKNCLDKIYEQNMARATPEEREKAKVIENGDAVDFVPGMLSLDYMQSMSTQEKFDHLVSFDGIGIKTAACILCFNFEIPVFAVDTHVYRMAQMLRWVPDFITQEDHVFMHLDHKVPDELKYGLHQAFWWHGQHCYRCKGTTDKKSKGWDDATCPLEHLIDRDNKIGTRNKGAPKEGEDAKPKKKKPKIEPGEKKIPSLLGVKKFKSAEEAAAAGYEIDRMPNNDAYGVRRANFLPGERVRWARVKKEQE